ncbi:AAA+-type ATPase [Toensbergia leucococca]|nr:AAA+-type ATPase [Toensbergia leucococca]
MIEYRLYSVRPLSKPARTDLKDAFRIYISPVTLLEHDLQAGHTCLVHLPEGSPLPAIAWPASEKIQDSVVQMSKFLQSLYGFRLGDKISITRCNASIANIQTVELSEILPLESKLSPKALDDSDRGYWAWSVKHHLLKADILCPSMVFDDLEANGEKRSFKVDAINSGQIKALYRFQSTSNIEIRSGPSEDVDITTHRKGHLEINDDGIGGLSKQVKDVNEYLAAYSNSPPEVEVPATYQPRWGNLILHGPPGTGKSMLLKKVAAAGWQKVFMIDGDTSDYHSKMAIRGVFAEAHRHQPSVIIIDDLELVAGRGASREETSSINIAQSLRKELDGLSDGVARVLVLAATKSIKDIDPTLRSPGRFSLEIEIPVPDLIARADILKLHMGLLEGADVVEIEKLSDRTHGYVGADLKKLFHWAVRNAILRAKYGATPVGDKATVARTVESDWNDALLHVRPTAMREVFIEKPNVRWSDVGGQYEIKRRLEEAIKWPFKVWTQILGSGDILQINRRQYTIEMERLAIEPAKALLLYGPPGCSKTLTAKALATEAGLNFISIKGPELLNMYVGESERAVREVFAKARAASPSILFFDEIDAIGASTEASNRHAGLHTVTTLLTELDGFEVLKGVFVIAATNKPEILDPALIRPGRFDNLLYIGLPDCEARREILEIRTRKMATSVDVDAAALTDGTEGYSGAEIINICQRASYAALREYDLSGEFQPVGRRHFDEALAEVPRLVTPEMTTRYKIWAGRGLKPS